MGDPLDVEFASYEDMVTMSVKHAMAAAKKLRSLQERFNPEGSDIYP